MRWFSHPWIIACIRKLVSILLKLHSSYMSNIAWMGSLELVFALNVLTITHRPIFSGYDAPLFFSFNTSWQSKSRLNVRKGIKTVCHYVTHYPLPITYISTITAYFFACYVSSLQSYSISWRAFTVRSYPPHSQHWLRHTPQTPAHHAQRTQG